MGTYTERFSEQHEVLAQLDPHVYGAGEQNTGYVSCRDYHRIAVLILTGAMSAAVDVDIEEATDILGAGAQQFDAGGKDVNMTEQSTCYIIEIRGEEFDTANNYDALNVELTFTDNAEIAVLVLGTVPRFKPVGVTQVNVVD